MGKPDRVTHVILDFFNVVHPDPQGTWLEEQGLDRDGGGFSAVDEAFDLDKLTYPEYVKQYASLAGVDPNELADYFANFRADPQMERLVADLRRNYGVGLLSNANPAEIRPMLGRSALEFDDTVVSGEVGMRKPDEEIFRLALGRLGASAETTVFVDDTMRNVEAAKNIGMIGLHFTGHDALRADLQELGVLTPVPLLG